MTMNGNTPTRNTWKGHDYPATFIYFGRGGQPAAEGVPVLAEGTSGAISLWDASTVTFDEDANEFTGDVVARIGNGSRFWAGQARA